MTDEVASMLLVKECRELEEEFGTHLVHTSSKAADAKEVKKTVDVLDREKQLVRCTDRASQIAEVACNGGWLRLWDMTLDFGGHHTEGLLTLSRLMGHHDRVRKPCLV